LASIDQNLENGLLSNPSIIKKEDLVYE